MFVEGEVEEKEAEEEGEFQQQVGFLENQGAGNVKVLMMMVDAVNFDQTSSDMQSRLELIRIYSG